MMQELRPTQSSFWIFIQKSFEEVFEVPIDTFRIQNWIFADVFDQSDEIWSSKGRISCGQLIQDDSHTPQISRMIVGLLFDDLGSHIKRRSF